MDQEKYYKDYYVVPSSTLSKIKTYPLLNSLYVSDIGYFPNAAGHFKERRTAINEAILIINKSGKGFVNIEGREFILDAFQAVIIKPGCSHSYGADQQDPWSILWAHFSGSFVELFLNKMDNFQPLIQFDQETLSLISPIFEDVFKHLRTGYSFENLIYTSSAFYAVLGKIIYGNDLYIPHYPDKHSIIVERVISFMTGEAGTASMPTLKDFTNLSGLSVPHFSAIFKEKTDYAPCDYFARLKIQHACRYLETTNYKVYEIASKLGYEDPYYFSRLFSKIIGKSPSEYCSESRVLNGNIQINNCI